MHRHNQGLTPYKTFGERYAWIIVALIFVLACMADSLIN